MGRHEQCGHSVGVVLICCLMFDDCSIRCCAGDKQYHSDDGYTSDPGIIREEEDDDETDENTETTDGADVSGILNFHDQLS